MAEQGEGPNRGDEIGRLVRITGKASLNGFEFGGLGLLAAGPLGLLLGGLVGATYGGVSSGVDGLEKPYVEQRRAAAAAEAAGRSQQAGGSRVPPPSSEGLPRGGPRAPISRMIEAAPQQQQRSLTGSRRARGRRSRGGKRGGKGSASEEKN